MFAKKWQASIIVLAFLAVCLLLLGKSSPAYARALESGPAFAPGAFSKLSPLNGAAVYASNPVLRWGASSGALRYDYCIDKVNDNNCNTGWVNNGLILNVQLAGLTVNTTYYWQVRALNATGITLANGGAWWAFRVVPPKAFSKLSPANGAAVYSNTTTLAWQASTGAARYEYCFDKVNDNVCNTAWVNNGLVLNKAIGGLTAGTYFWQVRAVGLLGTTYANGGAWWVFRVLPPGGFTKIKPPNGSAVYVPNPVLTWSASAGAARYEYCVDKVNDNVCNTAWVNSGLALNKQLAGLGVGAYFWQVRAINPIGVTYANGGVWWVFRVVPPGAFTKISPPNGGVVYVPNPVLTWGPSAGATRYEYCIDQVNNNACDTAWVNNGLALNKALAGLGVGVYYWQVRAINLLGVTYANGGAWWAFKVSPPGGFTKIKPPNGAVVYVPNPVLTWGASAGAVRYEYCVDKVNNNACDTAWVNNGLVLNKALAGLGVGAYYWQVRAINLLGVTYANGGTWWVFRVSPPGAFTKLSPANGAALYTPNPKLVWGASAGAARYEYCIDQVNNNACDTAWVNNGLALNKQLAGLGIGAYYWQVRAINLLGVTYANGGAWWAFKISTPPNFSKLAPRNGAVIYIPNPVLTWQASAGTVRYEYCIDRVNNNACDTAWVNNLLALNKPLAGLTEGAYYWQVRAVGLLGTTYANGGAWWVFRVSRPAAFTKLSPANSAAVYIPNPTLKWGPSAGALRYEYCIDKVNNNACDTAWVNNGLVLSKQMVALGVGTYYWQVRAINLLGVTYANGGAWWLFRVSAPGAFVKISPANAAVIVTRSPTLDWGPSAGAAKYEYCIDKVNNNICDTAWVSTGLNTQIALAGLGNATYYWQVRATNLLGVTYANAGVWWRFTVLSLIP